MPQASDPSNAHATELIGFWQRCDLSRPPFTHPKDCRVLQSHKNYIYEEPVDFATFISGPHFGDFTDRRFHLSLLPSPYCGDLRTADIFILLLNPGFKSSDYYAESCVPQFRRRLELTLRQDFSGVDFPFVFLDPEFCWHSGFCWWEEKLREVIRIIAKEKFDSKYMDALRSLSKRLASLELIPYHSPSFNAHSIIKKLPSACAIKRFAKGVLEDTLNHGDKTIIVTRQVAAWELPGTPRNLIRYEGGHTRGASLGPKSLGGRAILERYGISDG